MRDAGLRGAVGRAVVLCVLVLLTGCGEDDRPAEELFTQGTLLIEEGDLDGGVALMQRILDEHPDSHAAKQVRGDWSYYEELLRIEAERFPRIAAEDLRRIGKALEKHRGRRGRYPEALQDLVPRELDELPADPWGRDYLYQREGRRYVARTLGRDGEPGGSGRDGDIRLADGILRNAPGIRRR